jgi:glycerophosphoryl diester phosphodiesterase
LHDPQLDRTTDGRGLVGDYRLEDLRRLDAGLRFAPRFAGERVPTLEEALDLLRAVRVIIEIKNAPVAYPGIAGRVAAAARSVGHPAITISSFDHLVLLEVRRVAPALETAVLFSARPVNALALAQEAHAAVLHPQWMYLSREMIDAAHGAGVRVETWTVDDPVQINAVLDLGPDGVMSNYPDRLRSALAARRYELPPSQPRS